MAAASDRADKKMTERTSKYFREVRAELRKVIWPRRNEVVTSTIVVMITVTIVALIIAGFDLIFSYIVRLVTSG